MKNGASNLIVTNLVGVHPSNMPTKFEANPCSGFGEEDDNDDNDNNGSLESDSLSECD